MFKESPAFSSFSTDDLAKTEAFYQDTLGLAVKRLAEPMAMLMITLGSGAKVLAYQKVGHTPASFTILNFPVPDVDQAVEKLKSQGVVFEANEMTDTDGIARGRANNMGPDIAWFKDPSGNWLAVLDNKD